MLDTHSLYYRDEATLEFAKCVILTNKIYSLRQIMQPIHLKIAIHANDVMKNFKSPHCTNALYLKLSQESRRLVTKIACIKAILNSRLRKHRP